MVIDHYDPLIHTSGTRTVAGKTTQGAGDTTAIDGQLRIKHPEPEKTVRPIKVWSDMALIMPWKMTEKGTTYFSDIRTSMSADGRVRAMAEQYHEPGMERIREWIFENQKGSAKELLGNNLFTFAAECHSCTRRESRRVEG